MLRIDTKKGFFLSRHDSQLTANFWIGLGLALGFHLALFALLKITSPPNIDRFTPIVPVAVEVDLGKPLCMPSIDQVTLTPIQLLGAPPLLDIPKPQITVEFPFFKHALFEPDFSEIEKIDYELFIDLEEDV